MSLLLRVGIRSAGWGPGIVRGLREQTGPVLLNSPHRQRRESTGCFGELNPQSCTDQEISARPIRASHGYLVHGKVSPRKTGKFSLLMKLSQPFW